LRASTRGSTLGANLGSQALTTTALFGGIGNGVERVLGQLSQPLFNAGLPAERRAAQAALDAAAANYQRVVLEALRGVADALQRGRARRPGPGGPGSQRAGCRGTAPRGCERQYNAGAASPVQLLVADQQLLQARSGLASRRRRCAWLDTVALGAAMAGDPAPRQDAQVSLRNPQESR
jgi:outer membrane protein TolC